MMLAAALFSPSAFACCGASAAGAADAMKAAVMSALDSYDRAVIEQLKANAADQISATETLRKSLLAALDALTQEMETYNQEIAKRVEQYKTEKELDRTYGLSDATRQVICDDAVMADSAGTGVVTARGNAAARADASKASWGAGADWSPVKAIAEGAKLTDAQLDASRLTRLDDPLSEEDRKKLIDRLVNFSPPAPIPDEAAKTPAGAIAKSIDNERRLRESVVRDLLSEVDAQTDPVIDYEGQKLSVRAIIALFMEKMGYLSVPYRESINTMDEEDILRQIVVQQAFSNFVQEQIYRLDLKGALVQASSTALQQNQKFDERLLEQKARAARQ